MRERERERERGRDYPSFLSLQDSKKGSNKLWMNKLGRKEGSSQLLSFTKKDPFNLSNDEYYNPNHATSTQGLPGFDQSNIVQHSTPALDLHLPWFPTHFSTHTLRQFHRPILKIKVQPGAESTGWVTVNGLVKQIVKKEKVWTTVKGERERERERERESGRRGGRKGRREGGEEGKTEE